MAEPASSPRRHHPYARSTRFGRTDTGDAGDSGGGMIHRMRTAFDELLQSPAPSSHRNVLHMEADVVAMRARILELEGTVSALKVSAEQLRADAAKEKADLERAWKADVARVQALEKQRRSLADQEETAKNRCEEVEARHSHATQHYEARVRQLEREKAQLASELAEMRAGSRAHGSEAAAAAHAANARAAVLQTELQGVRAELATARKRAEDASTQAAAATALQAELLKIQQHARDLEARLRRAEERAEFAKGEEAASVRLAQMEREHRAALGELRYLRETAANAEILHETIEDYKGRLARADERATELLARVAALEASAPEASGAMQRGVHAEELVALRVEQAVLLEASGRAKEETSRLSALAESLGARLATVTGEASRLRDELRAAEEGNQRLQAQVRNANFKQAFFLRDRDGLRRILDSYAEDAGANAQAVASERIAHAEDALRECRELLAAAERDADDLRTRLDAANAQLAATGGELAATQLRLSEAESSREAMRVEASRAWAAADAARREVGLLRASTDSDGARARDSAVLAERRAAEALIVVEQARREVGEREAECVALRGRLAALQTLVAEQQQQLAAAECSAARAVQPTVSDAEVAKLRQALAAVQAERDALVARVSKGDFNPETTRVLHMRMNPELLALREEGARLRARVAELEASGAVGATAQPQELAALREALAAAEVREDRLKTVFKKRIQSFREACYALTGYKIDMREDEYVLLSMYAERQDDTLVFRGSPSGLQLLETPFSAGQQALIDAYLRRFNSIPAFLSEITLQLFSRQTRT